MIFKPLRIVPAVTCIYYGLILIQWGRDPALRFQPHLHCAGRTLVRLLFLAETTEFYVFKEVSYIDVVSSVFLQV